MTRARRRVTTEPAPISPPVDGKSRKRKREQDLGNLKEECPSPQNTDNVKEIESPHSILVEGVGEAASPSKRSRSNTAKQEKSPSRPRKKKATDEPKIDARAKSKVEEVAEKVHIPKNEQSQPTVSSKTSKSSRARGKKSVKVDVEEKAQEEAAPAPAPAKRRRKQVATKSEDIDGEGEAAEQKPKRRRKTKEEKEREAMPLAARSQGLKYFVGAHVSIAKGLENAVTNISHVGGNAFALFLKSQRKWENPPLQDSNRDAFRQHCINHKYDSASHVVPHGSYLVNLATEDKSKAAQSYSAFIDDLHRCEALGIKYYNFHPGAASKSPLPEAISRLANNLNRALSETTTVVPLLENMAGHGSIIGSRFSDLASIISLIQPQHKSRIGVCLDTCHAFAAGYDLRSPESFASVLQDFDQTVGMKYLKALHINDSKAPLGSHRDLHQNIGLGFLGLRAFHNVMNEPRLQGLPLILETPCDRPDPDPQRAKEGKTIDDKNVWAREIKLLESLTGMDVNGEEFKRLEGELAEEGMVEREKMEKWYVERAEKVRKKAEREARKKGGDIRSLLGKKKTKEVVDGQDESGEDSALSELESELSDLSSEEEDEKYEDTVKIL